MEIIGLHVNKFNDGFSKCKIQISHGIIGIYAHKNTNYNKLNQPHDDTKFKLRKINEKDDPPPAKEYTHIIEYRIEKFNKQKILINENRWTRLKIKKEAKQLWIQSKTLWSGIWASLIVMILSTVADDGYNAVKTVIKSQTINLKTPIKTEKNNPRRNKDSISSPSLMSSQASDTTIETSPKKSLQLDSLNINF